MPWVPATCETPLGPCTKRRGPVLASRVGMSGPGGAEFFLDATGRSLIAYHAWPDPPAPDGERALFVDLAENLLR